MSWTKPVPSLADAAFEHRLDSQLLAHLPEIVSLPSELKRRRPRHHPQAFQPRQRVDEFLGEAVAEILLLRIGAHVRERQDGYGGHVGRSRC